MATLYFEDGPSSQNLESIQKELSPLGVKLSMWEIPDSEGAKLLKKETLSEKEKSAALQALDVYFERLKEGQRLCVQRHDRCFQLHSKFGRHVRKVHVPSHS